MSLLREIRKQPAHIRELLFGLSVLVTVLVVGAVWLSSFQRNVYALLNPSQEDQQQFADQRDQSLPLRASIGTLLGRLRASIYTLFDFDPDAVRKEQNKPDDTVHTLPTAETRR